jgi:hypothetical protein
MTERGKPRMVVSDNGTELTSNAILTWVDQSRVGWHCVSRRASHAECVHRELQWPATGRTAMPTPIPFVVGPGVGTWQSM